MKKHGEIVKRDYPKSGQWFIEETWFETDIFGDRIDYITPIARFEKVEDRDIIFDAMKLAGYCGHSKASWIRSIPPVERNKNARLLR
jgi:hypothetical protein